ncbi:MAG: hypothetical protein ACJ75R_08765 [Solirubrobacterales bacterium]
MATTPEQTRTTASGGRVMHCPRCGSQLAVGQRYCLECGARTADPPAQYATGPASAGAPAVSAPSAAPPPRSSDVSPFGVVLGIALLGGMLLIGVLLGRGTDDSNQTPQVVTVSSATTTPTTTTESGKSSSSSGEAVASEWPPGIDGWTVELGTLPKDGTTAADVDSTRQSLSDQGASAVGVLDADLYPPLPAGNYVVYSGVYDTRADAEAALKKLGSDFGDAQVVEVSSQAGASGSGTSAGGGLPGSTGAPGAGGD